LPDYREIPPVKPYFPEEDIKSIQKEVAKILKSGMLTLGEYTRRFEEEFAGVCDARYAIAVNSGTSALEIALRAIGLKNGDEVLIPTNTFTATAATVLLAGGRPVFTDIDAASLCINAENVQEYITGNTKGVMAVHIGGLVCPEIKEIREICEDEDLFLIEDAAHAQGSSLGGKPAGSFGDAGCFSFYPTKVMTTGEGGIITTNTADVAQKAKVLRDQGKDSFSGNNIIEVGYNWRMTEISAAIGSTQLRKLHEFVGRRSEIASYYDGELSENVRIKPLSIPENAVSNYYKYIAFLSADVMRDDFKQKLREMGVRLSGEVYWPPLHMQPVYERLLGVKEGSFPVAEEVCRRMICLPMYSQMTMEEARYVAQRVREVLSSSVGGSQG